MMKNTFLKISVLMLALAIGVVSCKKKDDDDDEELEYDTQSSFDNAVAEATWNDMGSMSDQAADGTDSLSSYRPSDPNSMLGSGCATVTFTPGSPNLITVDFGPNWCLCSDARYRKGKFTITFTGNYADSGTVVTVNANTSDNYYVSYPATTLDSNKWIRVTGARTVTNRGTNASGNLQYDVSVNGTLYNFKGEMMTWTSTRTREWISGSSTPAYWLDDKYAIRGTANGVSFEGVSFNVSIDSSNPLFVDFTCFMSQPYSCKITKGIFSLTPLDKPTRTVDYGTGACDNVARCTVNGVSFDIYVR